MLYLDIILSILDVIVIIIPILFIVALVTVAERRTLASMQRRMGPNNVGQFKFNTSFKRSYHNSIIEKLSDLYLNRKASFKPF